jgi:hypothetical protein
MPPIGGFGLFGDGLRVEFSGQGDEFAGEFLVVSISGQSAGAFGLPP